MSPGRIFRHFPPFTTAFLLALAVLCCGVYRSLSPDAVRDGSPASCPRQELPCDSGTLRSHLMQTFCLTEQGGSMPGGGYVQASRNNGSQARLRRLTFRNNDSFVRGGGFVSARPVSQVRAFIGAASVLSGTAEHGGLFLALRKLRL